MAVVVVNMEWYASLTVTYIIVQQRVLNPSFGVIWVMGTTPSPKAGAKLNRNCSPDHHLPASRSVHRLRSNLWIDTALGVVFEAR